MHKYGEPGRGYGYGVYGGKGVVYCCGDDVEVDPYQEQRPVATVPCDDSEEEETT